MTRQLWNFQARALVTSDRNRIPELIQEWFFEQNRTSSLVFDMHISSREGKGLEK
jgi:hypothetical protein